MRAGSRSACSSCPGEDPDSFLRKRGGPAFAELLAGPRTRRDSWPAPRGRGENPSAEARVRRYVEVIGRVEDPIRRRLLVRRGAEAFSVGGTSHSSHGAQRGPKAAHEVRTVEPPPPAASPAPERADAQSAGSRSSQSAGPGEPVDRSRSVESNWQHGFRQEDQALGEAAAHGGVDCFGTRGSGPCSSRGWLVRVPNYRELRDLMSESGLARAVLFTRPSRSRSRRLPKPRAGRRALIERLEEPAHPRQHPGPRPGHAERSGPTTRDRSDVWWPSAGIWHPSYIAVAIRPFSRGERETT